MELKFRTLNANEIECRVGNTIKDKETNQVKGFGLLLYKTARVDAMILDETVGVANWQKKFYQVKNTMICSLGILTENGWVWKDDAGDDDFQTEQVKGEASDSFKRAGFAWGIGRELYFGPKITIWTNSGNKPSDRYSVKEVEFDKDKVMTKLTIVNDYSGEVAYSYVKGKKVSQTSENNPKSTIGSGRGTIRATEKALINNYLQKCTMEQCNVFYKTLEKRFGTMNYEMLSDEQGVMVCQGLKLM